MRKLEFYNNTGELWRQIDKRKARKLYDSGQAVMICASNLQPFGTWHPAIYLDGSLGESFDDHVIMYTYYNCTDSETGYYPVFYEEVAE